MHAPKLETFRLVDHINVDPKGIDRTVDTYERHEFGLYMARGANHPRFGYLESWLLPDLGLRVNKFHERAGGHFYQDFYIDVASIEPSDAAWTTRDLYIDLLSTTGSPITVDDIDELSQATAQGLISAEDAEFAIEATLRAVDGITRHNDNVLDWLTAIGYPLTWAEHVELVPEG